MWRDNVVVLYFFVNSTLLNDAIYYVVILKEASLFLEQIYNWSAIDINV